MPTATASSNCATAELLTDTTTTMKHSLTIPSLLVVGALSLAAATEENIHETRPPGPAAPSWSTSTSARSISPRATTTKS